MRCLAIFLTSMISRCFVAGYHRWWGIRSCFISARLLLYFFLPWYFRSYWKGRLSSYLILGTSAHPIEKANLMIWKKQSHDKVLYFIALFGFLWIESPSKCTLSSDIPYSPVRRLSELTHSHVISGLWRCQRMESVLQGCICVKYPSSAHC